MSFPAAYFITWSCYGHRLHGDVRGSVDRDDNQFNTPLLEHRPGLVEFERSMLKQEPVTLDKREREIVSACIERHCQIRQWQLEGVNVRTTHVHIVVRAAGYSPEVVMGQLKSWTTRRFRSDGCYASDKVVWTRHGSTRYLWQENEIPPTVRYVLLEQDNGDRYREP